MMDIKKEPLTQSKEEISSEEELSLDSREGTTTHVFLFAYFEVGSTVFGQFTDKKLFNGLPYYIEGTVMPSEDPELLTILFEDDDILEKPVTELLSKPPPGALLHFPKS